MHHTEQLHLSLTLRATPGALVRVLATLERRGGPLVCVHATPVDSTGRMVVSVRMAKPPIGGLLAHQVARDIDVLDVHAYANEPYAASGCEGSSAKMLVRKELSDPR